MDESIKQIPEIGNNMICSFCGSKVERIINKTIVIYGREYRRQKEIIRPLLYCDCCDLFYMSGKQYDVICKMYGYKPERFVMKDEYSLYQVREKIYNPPAWSLNFHKVKSKNKTNGKTCLVDIDKTQYERKVRPISTVNLQKLPKVIYKTNYELRECPACKHRLMEFVNVIPINQSECLPYKGKYCASCERFYDVGEIKVEKFIEHNPAAKEYTIEFDYFIPNYSEWRNKFDQLQSSVVLVVLKQKGKQNYRHVTIVKYKSEVSIEQDVLHYSDFISRTILTAIFYGREVVVLGDEEYVIEKTCTDDEFSVNDYTFLLKDIKLKKGGGYANYNGDEVVDVLLYSPYTGIFEIIRASYNKLEDEYYMDVGIFRRFINTYGYPGLPILFSASNKRDFRFSYLKEESLLHAYGYNVSQKDNLSDNYRRLLLSEIIDLELMKPYEIINLLTYNINSHSSIKDVSACMKWKNDIEFVSNYKVNPNRFIIASNIKK